MSLRIDSQDVQNPNEVKVSHSLDVSFSVFCLDYNYYYSINRRYVEFSRTFAQTVPYMAFDIWLSDDDTGAKGKITIKILMLINQINFHYFTDSGG